MSPGESIGKFQVLGTLGQGANSSILHVRRLADAKQYALKVVPVAGPDDVKFLEQAKHEFRVAKLLDHPNVVKVYAFEAVKDWLFRTRKAHLLIEYINGKTLDKMPILPAAKLVQLFQKIAGALCHMHRRGVVHADLKPGNIMLGRNGHVKIIDLGLAWVKDDPPKERIQGTPEYLAPETFKHKTVNERSEIFNFGATMYRLVTFRLPPAVGSLTEGIAVDARSYKAKLTPVAELNNEAPDELCELIHRCLEPNPNDRYARMGEVLERLDFLAERMVESSGDTLEALEW